MRTPGGNNSHPMAPSFEDPTRPVSSVLILYCTPGIITSTFAYSIGAHSFVRFLPGIVVIALYQCMAALFDPIHRKLTCYCKEDFVLAMASVGCSLPLSTESLIIARDLACDLNCTSIRHMRPHRQLTPISVALAESVSTSVDLSKAMRLNDVIFIVKSANVEWITVALQTITLEN